MNLQAFYNRFHHGKSHIQKKIINRNNFTYILCIKYLSRYIKNKHLKILDFGCGSGTLSYYLASKGNLVIGTDISNDAIKMNLISAKYVGVEDNCHFISINNLFNKNKFKNYFDMIICSEVIEHVKNDKGLIKKLNSLMKPKGILYVSTPSNNAPLYRMGLLSKFDEKVGHLRRYNYLSLEKLLHECNFKILQIHKVEGILRNSLFTNNYLGFLIKFIRGYISHLVMLIDSVTVRLFGESNFIVIAQKI